MRQLAEQVSAAGRADHLLAHVSENPIDLLIEFVAVGNHEDTALGIVFQQPLGEQDHEDALAAALGMPDDAAFVAMNKFLGLLDCDVLMYPWQLLLPAIK